MNCKLYDSEQLKELMKDRRNSSIHEATGVALGTIILIKRGACNPREETLRKLTEYFKVN